MSEKKKKYHHGDLRSELLDAVRALIERDGPDAFSIAEACRMAGVSTAAPYKHFADRSDIVKGAVAEAMKRLRDAMAKAAASHPPATVERIAAVGQAYVDFARHEPGMFRAVFGLSEGHSGDADLKALGEETFGVVRGVVADHLGPGASQSEIGDRAYALWCFVHGHSFLLIDGKLATATYFSGEAALLAVVGEAMLERPAPAGSS